MLVTIMIPTRGRPDKLIEAMDSAVQSAEGKDFEFILRVDDDDAQTLAIRSKLESEYGAYVIVGPRGRGWDGLDEVYFTECAEISRADWVWIYSDDARVKGNGWDTQLAKVPTSGFIVQPEFYQLNASIYPNPDWQGFPIFPRNCWKQVGLDKIPRAADMVLTGTLKSKLDWENHYLTGITFFHDRADDKTIEAHRAC